MPEPEKFGLVEIMIIDDKQYPFEQFWSSESRSCNYEMVWRTNTNKAIDVNGESLDARTDGCRFGLLDEFSTETVEMTLEQISKFQDLTGIRLTVEE